MVQGKTTHRLMGSGATSRGGGRRRPAHSIDAGSSLRVEIRPSSPRRFERPSAGHQRRGRRLRGQSVEATIAACERFFNFARAGDARTAAAAMRARCEDA